MTRACAAEKEKRTSWNQRVEDDGFITVTSGSSPDASEVEDQAMSEPASNPATTTPQAPQPRCRTAEDAEKCRVVVDDTWLPPLPPPPLTGVEVVVLAWRRDESGGSVVAVYTCSVAGTPLLLAPV